MKPVNRVDPKLPAGTMKTYQVVAPPVSHWRQATCAEVDCPYYLNGWVSSIDESTDLGKTQAWYIRNKSSRRFIEDRDQNPGITAFRFEAGQTCFGADQHLVRTARAEVYIVRGGDWRGNPTGDTRTHANADDWRDDFANHQAALADQIQKG